jgi:hypothetical protein
MFTLLYYAVEALVSMLFDPVLWATLLQKADSERDLERWNRLGL